MVQTQTNFSNGIPMPLLMGYTPSTRIQTMENVEPVIYDPVSQCIKVYDMRTIGTKSLKRSTTRKKSGSTGYVSASDAKNEIDDTKSVK
jgi:hypothetical protein